MVDRAPPITVGGPAGGSSPCRYCASGSRAAPAGGDGQDITRLAHLYVCQGLSTYAIGTITGLDRQRIAHMLRRDGIPLRPRGAGRLRPVRRADPPGLPQLLTGLYQAGRLSSPQIAALTGIPERTVRDRLRRYGIGTRTRGRWNREDRWLVPAQTLDDLYTQLGLTADQVGSRLGVSRSTVLRSAHALGVPVRAGGTAAVPGPEEIELVDALYDDPLIRVVLREHGIARVPPGAPIWQRFPRPVPLTTPLVKDLYWGCGAGLHHIELLTGHPAMTVRGFMRRAGISLRHPGGRTPFMRRWRSASSRAGRRGRPKIRQE